MTPTGPVPSDSGPYEPLYRAIDQLWNDEPGRMVRIAHEISIPGRALDLGCGDGKNLVWLESHGWTVDGVDVSPSAVSAAHRRVGRVLPGLRGSITRLNAARMTVAEASYDLVIAYGLYHCLDDCSLNLVHENGCRALRPGGLFVMAVIDDAIPIPVDHGTRGLHLRPWTQLLRLFKDLESLRHQTGMIHERHGRVVGWHTHAIQWAIFKK